MSDFSDLFTEWGATHDGTPTSVVVRPAAGVGAYGAAMGDPVTFTGVVVIDASRLIRGPDGNQIVSSCAIYVDIEHPDAPAITPASEVDVNGRTTKVIIVEKPDVFGLFGFVVVRCE